MVNLFDMTPFMKQAAPPEIAEMHCSFIPSEKVLIRYEIGVEHYTDGGSYEKVYRNKYPIIRETEKCYVIDNYGKTQFVLKGSDGKRFAYLDDESAKQSLRKRTIWRQSHAHWAMTKAHIAIRLFNELFPDLSKIEAVGIETPPIAEQEQIS